MIKNQKGQSLIEAMIALGVASLIVSAIAVASIIAVNNSNFSKYQNQATQYAQQGMEILRKQSHDNWTTFAGHAGTTTWCLNNVDESLKDPAVTNPGIGTCTPNINSFFIREVQMSNIGQVAVHPPNPDITLCNGMLEVTVRVKWTDGKCGSSVGNTVYCHDVTLTSCMTNLNQTPAI